MFRSRVCSADNGAPLSFLVLECVCDPGWNITTIVRPVVTRFSNSDSHHRHPLHEEQRRPIPILNNLNSEITVTTTTTTLAIAITTTVVLVSLPSLHRRQMIMALMPLPPPPPLPPLLRMLITYRPLLYFRTIVVKYFVSVSDKQTSYYYRLLLADVVITADGPRWFRWLPTIQIVSDRNHHRFTAMDVDLSADMSAQSHRHLVRCLSNNRQACLAVHIHSNLLLTIDPLFLHTRRTWSIALRRYFHTSIAKSLLATW